MGPRAGLDGCGKSAMRGLWLITDVSLICAAQHFHYVCVDSSVSNRAEGEDKSQVFVGNVVQVITSSVWPARVRLLHTTFPRLVLNHCTFCDETGTSAGCILTKSINVFALNIVNPLSPELNPICYLLALLGAHHFLHVSRIRVKSLTFRQLMSYIYIYIWSTHS